ncbi:MAG: GNAT family N-acetyltransferase [Rectinemataceae bacterium]
MIDIREYLKLARNSGAYKDIEIDILKETLITWLEHPGEPCSVVELRDGNLLAGFAVFARANNTEYSYDVRSICVDAVYRGKGVGQKLTEMIEEEVLNFGPQAIVRFEISKKKEAVVGEGFLLERNFAMIGHIKAFYDTEDDYFIYAKHVSNFMNREDGEGEDGGGGDGEAPEDSATLESGAAAIVAAGEKLA